jgi:hypothetical protein
MDNSQSRRHGTVLASPLASPLRCSVRFGDLPMFAITGVPDERTALGGGPLRFYWVSSHVTSRRVSSVRDRMPSLR